MAAPEAVRQAYDRVEPVVADVQRYVKATLEPYCSRKSYVFLDRMKSLNSLSEKLDGGRIHKWSEIDDLYGCTIVIPVASHEDEVVRKLDACFTQIRLRTRSDAQKAPDVFRFDGARWYGLVPAAIAAERQPGVDRQLFEVQIVTAFEWAWIVVTHDLVYKADHADWRRLRLAAQLKAAVEQIELLIAAFDSASSIIRESPWPESAAKTMTISRFRTLAEEGLIPTGLLPESWQRFADNIYALVRSYESNRNQIADRLSELLDVIEADLRGPDPVVLPLGGTLFQYVLSVVDRASTSGDLRRFVVVPSDELRDNYGIKALPQEFLFD